MKTILTLLISTFSVLAFGQVEEVSYDISLGEQNAFMTDHPNADKKMVEDVVENILKEYGKIKRNRKADEWACEECRIPALGSEPVKVYYKVVERKNLVTTYLFVDDGMKFISLSNEKEKANEIMDLSMDIYYEVKREIIRKQLEDQEDALGDYEKDLSKLVKKNEDLHDDIEKYKEKIRNAEKDIEENLNEQQDKKIEIEMQKRDIEKTIKKLNAVGRNS